MRRHEICPAGIGYIQDRDTGHALITWPDHGNVKHRSTDQVNRALSNASPAPPIGATSF
jgi:hypothetical protein